MSAPEGRQRRRGDTFYFLFQTLPVIIVLAILVVLTLGYGLIKLVF